MEIAQQYKKDLQEYNLNLAGLRELITIKQNQLRQLENDLQELEKNAPDWIDKLLRPTIAEINKALPDWTNNADHPIPHGTNSRMLINFFKQTRVLHIVILPGNLAEGELLYEIFESGNLDKKTKRLESIAEAVDYLQAQIKNI